MKIKELFEKDIFRPIETVIKADDRENIASEVAEYVITDEISKKIGNFFEAYCDYTGANGVWISGFFGSGKSHLLKILSYVLENKEYDGYKAGELFAEKVENDKLLQANIHKAARIPSESILFNIDQQSQIKAKEDADAILSVFYKVFYDHLGFYGFRPHVAEFEMWLDTQDRYHEFKDAFDQRHPQSWEEARKNYFDPDVEDDMAAACGAIFKNDPEKYQDILSKLEDKEKQSIEDFCNRVADYIASKPKGFRINFFVDEIGQYISDNTKLMLNLQTVAETLATKTGGNSWILVTSQSDMETVMGDLTDKQGNDFSRIQSRFAIKLPLTSANVDEVIEKRLLDKKEAQQAALLKTYEKESSHLSSLLSFSDAGRQFKGYKSDTDFARKYPFAPYQFDLFQECRRALAQHNVFQGRHASVGERSMLGVFQQVVKSLGDEDDRTLVTFDLMYQGISSELRPEIQTTFGVAKKNLDKPLALKVLKALFLVKYFGSFKATKRNVYVMLIDHLDIDLAKHEAAIDEALNILENQSYIQRNGEFYEFLTDDEKDIEQEIKNTTIDDGKVTSFLNEVLFNEIVKDARLKYLKNNQEYEFTRSVDGVAFSRDRELEIEFISQDYEGYENIEALSQQTMGSKKLRMVLPAMETFIRDIRMHIKTEKYARQSRGNTSKPEVTRILNEKMMQNAARRRDLIEQAKKAMADSVVYVNGTKQELNATSDPKTRVINAFQILIATVYPNLRMLKDVPFSEQTIKTTLFENQDDLFTGDDAVISEAETEMLNFIDRRKSQSDRTSLTDIKIHFTSGSYGWYPNAIWTIAAKLYKRGKIEFRQDAQTLEDSDVTTPCSPAPGTPTPCCSPKRSLTIKRYVNSRISTKRPLTRPARSARPKMLPKPLRINSRKCMWRSTNCSRNVRPIRFWRACSHLMRNWKNGRKKSTPSFWTRPRNSKIRYWILRKTCSIPSKNS